MSVRCCWSSCGARATVPERSPHPSTGEPQRELERNRPDRVAVAAAVSDSGCATVVDETTYSIKAETLILTASCRAAARARRRAAPRTWMVKSVTEGIEEAECTQ
jgi:hypothetical protein